MSDEICRQRNCELAGYRDRLCEPDTCGMMNDEPGDYQSAGDPWSALYARETKCDE